MVIDYSGKISVYLNNVLLKSFTKVLDIFLIIINPFINCRKQVGGLGEDCANISCAINDRFKSLEKSHAQFLFSSLHNKFCSSICQCCHVETSYGGNDGTKIY